MLRIRLTTLLWLTAFASAYFFVAQRLGYLHTAVLSAVLGLVVWSLLSRLGRWFYIPRFLVFLSGVIVLWIGGVDGRWVIDSCDDCGWSCDRLEYRFLGFPVWTYEDELPEIIYYVLRDLGRSCRHPKLVSWVKHRYWGGTYCACPCINGIMGMYPDPYTTAMSKRVRASGQADPNLAKRLQQRIIENQYDDYFWGALLVDWRTLAAYDEGKAREAHDWLSNSPANERKQITETHPEITAEYIESLYDDGAVEVIIIWQSQTYPWSKPRDIMGWVVVRLPTKGAQRQQIISRLNERSYLDS